MAIRKLQGEGIFNNCRVRGEASRLSKLTSAKVKQIWKLLQTGRYSISEVARRVGVTQSIVTGIRHGHTWGHLTTTLGPLPEVPKARNVLYGENAPQAKLTSEQAAEIYAASHKGARAVDLSKKYGVTPESISNIKAGRTWARATAHLRQGGAA